MAKQLQTRKQLARLVAATMAAARKIEGKRSVRTLSEDDVLAFIGSCQAYDKPIRQARCYAGAAFVPNRYRYRASITTIDYGWFGLPVVGEADAHRRDGRGPYITINGRKAA